MNKSKQLPAEVVPALQHQFNQQQWKRQQYKAGAISVITLIACLLLLASPTYMAARYSCLVMSIGPAIYMTAYLHLHPDSLRSRSGSLATATCLVVFLWLSAIGITVAALTRVIV